MSKWYGKRRRRRAPMQLAAHARIAARPRSGGSLARPCDVPFEFPHDYRLSDEQIHILGNVDDEGRRKVWELCGRDQIVAAIYAIVGIPQRFAAGWKADAYVDALDWEWFVATVKAWDPTKGSFRPYLVAKTTQAHYDRQRNKRTSLSEHGIVTRSAKDVPEECRGDYGLTAPGAGRSSRRVVYVAADGFTGGASDGYSGEASEYSKGDVAAAYIHRHTATTGPERENFWTDYFALGDDARYRVQDAVRRLPDGNQKAAIRWLMLPEDGPTYDPFDKSTAYLLTAFGASRTPPVCDKTVKTWLKKGQIELLKDADIRALKREWSLYRNFLRPILK